MTTLTSKSLDSRWGRFQVSSTSRSSPEGFQAWGWCHQHHEPNPTKQHQHQQTGSLSCSRGGGDYGVGGGFLAKKMDGVNELDFLLYLFVLRLSLFLRAWLAPSCVLIKIKIVHDGRVSNWKQGQTRWFNSVLNMPGAKCRRLCKVITEEGYPA